MASGIRRIRRGESPDAPLPGTSDNGSVEAIAFSRRRALLSIVLGSIAVNAALGIYALLVPDFGDLQAKVLGTSGCVTGAGMLALACLPAWERQKLALVPLAGMAAAAAGSGLLVVGIWAEPGGEAFTKTALTLLWLAVALALSSLVSLARLAPRYRWAYPAVVSLALLLVALGAAALWGEFSDKSFYRGLGVVAVLLAAVTLAVPILHRASRHELAPAEPGARPVGFCPRCGRSLSAEADAETTCPGCGARFIVHLLIG